MGSWLGSVGLVAWASGYESVGLVGFMVWVVARLWRGLVTSTMMVWSNSIMGFGSGVCCGSNYGGCVEERIYGDLGFVWV